MNEKNMMYIYTQNGKYIHTYIQWNIIYNIYMHNVYIIAYYSYIMEYVYIYTQLNITES